LIIFIINLWYYTGKTWKQIYCPLCDSDNIRLSTISKVNKEYCVRLYCDGCEKAMTLTGNLVSTRGKVEK